MGNPKQPDHDPLAIEEEDEVSARLDAMLRQLNAVDASPGGRQPMVESGELGIRQGPRRLRRAAATVAPVLTAKRVIDQAAAEPDFYDLLKWRVGQQSRLTPTRSARRDAERAREMAHARPEAADEPEWRDWSTDEQPSENPSLTARARTVAEGFATPPILALGLMLLLGSGGAGVVALITGGDADTARAVAALPIGGERSIAGPLPAETSAAPQLLPREPTVRPERPSVTAARPTTTIAAEVMPEAPSPPSMAAEAEPRPEPETTGQESSPTFTAFDDVDAPAAPEADPAEVATASVEAGITGIAASQPTSGDTGPLGYVEQSEPSFPDFQPERSAPRPDPAPTTVARAGNADIAEGLATAKSYVNLRAGPDNGAATVAIVPKGATVTVVGCEIWCQVRHEGRTGYIFPSFLTRR